MDAQGRPRPGGGLLTCYEPPSGPGIRVDGFGYSGYTTSPRYDSLLAKVITHGDDLDAALRKARRALSEFKIEGARSNVRFLQALLAHAPLSKGFVDTRSVED